MPKQSLLYIAAVTGGGAFLRAVVSTGWAAYKKRVAERPIKLRRDRRGVYTAWSHVTAVEGVLNAFLLWVICPLLLLGVAAGIIAAFR